MLSKKIIYAGILKNTKKDIILHTLNPYDPEMQRYLSLSKRIEQLMNNAEDENDPCVPVELMAEFFVLQEELYQKALKKNKEEAN